MIQRLLKQLAMCAVLAAAAAQTTVAQGVWFRVPNTPMINGELCTFTSFSDPTPLSAQCSIYQAEVGHVIVMFENGRTLSTNLPNMRAWNRMTNFLLNGQRAVRLPTTDADKIMIMGEAGTLEVLVRR